MAIRQLNQLGIRGHRSHRLRFSKFHPVCSIEKRFKDLVLRLERRWKKMYRIQFTTLTDSCRAVDTAWGKLVTHGVAVCRCRSHINRRFPRFNFSRFRVSFSHSLNYSNNNNNNSSTQCTGGLRPGIQLLRSVTLTVFIQGQIRTWLVKQHRKDSTLRSETIHTFISKLSREKLSSTKEPWTNRFTAAMTKASICIKTTSKPRRTSLRIS